MGFNPTESNNAVLAREYESQREWLSERQWFEVFPESKDYLHEQLLDFHQKKDALEKEAKEEIRKHLKQQYPQEFDKWFKEKTISVFYLEPIKELDKKIQKINCLIEKPKEVEGQLTNNQIQRARQYPIENIVGAKSNKYNVKCPFHAGGQEKHPSLCLKGNYYFCFTCSEKGDTINLLMALRGINFREAVLSLQ